MPQDPLERGPKPPQPSQQQRPPGLESEMNPRPDYGESSYRGCGKLAGKAAVITGGASGIGAACAATLAREGAKLVVTDVDDQRGQAVVDKIRRNGAEAAFLPQEVTKEER